MTSSNGNISELLALCVGNLPVTGEFPTQRPVTRSLDVFFDLRLNKRLAKQWWGWWFEMPSRSLWRHCNGYGIGHCNFWSKTRIRLQLKNDWKHKCISIFFLNWFSLSELRSEQKSKNPVYGSLGSNVHLHEPLFVTLLTSGSSCHITLMPNEGLSFHQPLNCLFKSLFRQTITKSFTLVFHCVVIYWWFPAQRTSNVECVSMT